MMSIFDQGKAVTLASFVALGAALLAAPASAQNAQVVVPDTPTGGAKGCYRVVGDLYGPYRMNFCLEGKGGSYTVTGGGLSCRAGLDWNRKGASLTIQLGRASCNRGTAWSADTLRCQVQRSGAGPARRPRVGAQVMVPEPPGGGRVVTGLDCRYMPSVATHRPTHVSAIRLR